MCIRDRSSSVANWLGRMLESYDTNTFKLKFSSGNTMMEMCIRDSGAAVLIEGTTTGSVTDVNGNFVLSVPSKDAVLVVSYIGMATGKVKMCIRDRICSL